MSYAILIVGLCAAGYFAREAWRVSQSVEFAKDMERLRDRKRIAALNGERKDVTFKELTWIVAGVLFGSAYLYLWAFVRGITR